MTHYVHFSHDSCNRVSAVKFTITDMTSDINVAAIKAAEEYTKKHNCQPIIIGVYVFDDNMLSDIENLVYECSGCSCDGKIIYITKTLNVCNKCHEFFDDASDIFINGKCRCGGEIDDGALGLYDCLNCGYCCRTIIYE